MIVVLPVKPCETYQWLINRHYAKRICPISYAFGAYIDGVLSGVVTYGVPVSSPLRNGVCGENYSDIVLELNRLCCDTVKNLASTLVGRSIRMLPKPSIIVSYADTDRGHVGYIYQATNFIYTGLSAKRTDWKIKGMEHLHGATVADMSRGKENRAQYMRDKYGDDFYLKDRPQKHRYIFFVGSKTQVKKMRKALKYKRCDYPKAESIRYNDNGNVQKQGVLFL
jgi:hypothetical protein